MRLILQTIATMWTKASRGAPGSTRRNAVPEHLAIPTRATQFDGHWRHAVVFDEKSDFEQDVAMSGPMNTIPAGARGLEIIEREDRLICNFEQPRPGSADMPKLLAFTLKPGESGRLVFNLREVVRDEWHYRKTVHNLAWVDTCDEDIFEDVDHHFESLIHLS